MTDPTTSDVLGALSTPLPQDSTNLSRRRFLQAVGAGMAITALPNWMTEAASAASTGSGSDGVLVLLTMGGGNDGLNTFVPTGDGAYYDARGSLAVRPGEAINLGGGRGLNPNLPYMKTLWDQGRVAVVDGVGHQAETLSHFVSMAHVMAATNSRPPFQTGWLGRFLDDAAATNPFAGLSLGGSIPLLVKGRSRDAIGLPDHGKDILRTTDIEPTYARQNEAIRAFGVGGSGLGPMGDHLGAAGRRAVDYAATVAPMFDDRDDEARVVTKMRLAARLINANLGVRVVSIVFGDFDSHAGQATMHRDRMREINAGLKTFFSTLKAEQRNRTLVVGTSEFGRRVAYNGSGTDHGTANSLFLVGNQVKPGFHGQPPSLRNLDRYGNPVPTVDMMAFYSTIATTWLGADASDLFGGNYENLGFLNKPGSAVDSTNTGGNTASIRQRRARVARAHLALLGTIPDEEQFEKVADSHVTGRRTVASAATAIAESAAFRAAYGTPGDSSFIDIVYRAVHGRGANASERTTWTKRFASGTPRGQLVASLIDVPAFVKRTNPEVLKMEMAGPVGRLYYAYFLRQPKEQGLNYWINAGAGVPVVSDNFASSSEFARRYGSLNNRQFVQLVYRNVLEREAVGNGLDYWTSLLNRGRSRGQIMVGFSNSDEFKKKVKKKVNDS